MDGWMDGWSEINEIIYMWMIVECDLKLFTIQ